MNEIAHDLNRASINHLTGRVDMSTAQSLGPVFLGIDIGTTSIKGAVLRLDAAGGITATQQLPFPAPVANLRSGRCEVAPQAIVEVARQLIEQLAASTDRCDGIVSCGQMHGFVLVDPAGNAASNYISWRDQRSLEISDDGSATYLDHLLRRLGPIHYRELGNEMRPGIALASLFQMFHSGEYQAGPLMPVPITDYIMSHMSGEPPSCDDTHATSLGAFYLPTGDWEYGVAKELGLGLLRWPRVIRFPQVAYHVPTRHGRLACYPPLGDHQCSLLGVDLQPGELSINASTGAQVATVTPEYRPGDYQTRPYVDTMYLNTITHIPSGRSLTALVELFTEFTRVSGQSDANRWEIIGRLAEEVPETDAQIDLAFYQGALGNRGCIHNLNENNLRIGHLFRAALRTMADNFQLCAGRLGGGAWDRLVLAGGLFHRFPLLQQMVLERFNLPFRIGATEEVLLGLLARARQVA